MLISNLKFHQNGKEVAILYGDGEHDDTDALNAYNRGERVMHLPTQKFVQKPDDGILHLPPFGTYKIRSLIQADGIKLVRTSGSVIAGCKFSGKK